MRGEIDTPGQGRAGAQELLEPRWRRPGHPALFDAVEDTPDADLVAESHRARGEHGEAHPVAEEQRTPRVGGPRHRAPRHGPRPLRGRLLEAVRVEAPRGDARHVDAAERVEPQ